MKRLALIAIMLCVATSLAFAAEQAATTTTSAAPAVTAAETVTITGDIIDNMCAGANAADLSNFVKTHTKQCALMPDCAASGYAIVVDGKLTKFDKDSNAKVAEFLKKEDSKLQVVVTAKKVGDELSLVSIDNQK